MSAIHLTKSVALLAVLGCLWTAPATAQRLNTQHTLARGLVSWWRAVPSLAGGRIWYDLMGHAPGTLTGMTTSGATSGWAPPTRPGSVAEMRFDGTDDYVVTPVSARLFPAETTVMLWLRRTATGGSFQTLFAADGVERVLRVSSGGVIYFTLHFTWGYFDDHLTATPTLAVGPWYHLTMTQSAPGGFRFYLNCAEYQFFAPDGVATFVPVTSKAQFGAADSSGLVDFFTGTLDDVRVYNRALAPVEVCQAMRDSTQGEPRLLPPSLLTALLGTVAGNRGSFLPFFQPAQ